MPHTIPRSWELEDTTTSLAEEEVEVEAEVEAPPPSLDAQLGDDASLTATADSGLTVTAPLDATAKWGGVGALGATAEFAAAEAEAEAETEAELAAAAAAEQEGAALFAELLSLQPAGAASAEKEDYYNDDEGWDLAGLKSDLAISRASAASKRPHPALSLTTD